MGGFGRLGVSSSSPQTHRSPKSPRSPKNPGRPTIELIKEKLYCASPSQLLVGVDVLTDRYLMRFSQFLNPFWFLFPLPPSLRTLIVEILECSSSPSLSVYRRASSTPSSSYSFSSSSSSYSSSAFLVSSFCLKTNPGFTGCDHLQLRRFMGEHSQI